MSPVLFQDFMDLYMKFYNSIISSFTKDSQTGGGSSQLASSQSASSDSKSESFE